MCMSVSIHAPVWGATLLSPTPQIKIGVSIHAPVWGATILLYKYVKIVCFNPRTRVGCDAATLPNCKALNVSIHAPVWGATFFKAFSRLAFCFNPRTRVGCDQGQLCWLVLCWFQSTHPCGVRLYGRGFDANWILVSIHAPVWGATRCNN